MRKKSSFYKLGKALILVWLDIWSWIKRMIYALGPVEDSIKGVISEKELYRVIATAGSCASGLWGLCQYLYTNIDQYVTDPEITFFVKSFIVIVRNNWIIAVIFAVIFIGDFIRRKYTHGNTNTEVKL